MFEIHLKGRIQGVGFRPFVYNLCTSLNLRGFVLNSGADAIIGLYFNFALPTSKPRMLKNFIPAESICTPFIDSAQSVRFFKHFFQALPEAAHITKIIIYKPLDSGDYPQHFEIRPSLAKNTTLESAIPTDLATCKDCLDEIFTPTNRHYFYHLTSCTNCGGRYSMIKALPYDRKNTAMQGFALCEDCTNDYTNPQSRYYHAQPISCNQCSVGLHFWQRDQILASDVQAILLCAQKLKEGAIVCLKGLGGFALVCDATNKQAIASLRKAKNRPKKPFAIMAKDISQAEQITDLHPLERQYLSAPFAPIVLATKHKNVSNVAFDEIAPNLDSVGILLANTPLQHILFWHIDFPLIYTSANLKGEPIITHLNAAKEKLSVITSYFLDYEREIYQGVDDSIFRLIAGEMRPIRIARGVTPLHISLPTPPNKSTILAFGAQDKTNLCLSHNGQFALTPYIGDMQTIATQEKYIHTLKFFSSIYNFTPQLTISDMHPRYQTTQMAKHFPATHLQIYHHHAHLCAILAESKEQEILGIIWDGSGLGSDKTIWGGEVLFGGFLGFERLWHFEEILLIGGERAIKEIDRIGYALALLASHQEMITYYEQRLPQAIIQMAKKRINTFECTSVGRLFDGVASLLGILHSTSYEGESGGILESLYDKNGDFGLYDFSIENGVIKINKMFYQICQEIAIKIPKCIIVTKFIHTLAHITLQCSVSFLQNRPDIKVGFSGGVFQNKVLCEKIATLFSARNIPFIFHSKVPTNDGGIAFGQAAFGAFYVKERLCKPYN